MSLKCSYRDVGWSECFADKNERTACDADMIVPDAKSDIAKVISVAAEPSVSSVEYSSGRVTVSGLVKFNVLYISDEENPRVMSITKSSPFTHVCICGSDEENVVCIAVPKVLSTDCTPVNSRRIKASCEISLSILCCQNIRSSILTMAEGAECLSREITLSALKAFAMKDISINETADIPAGKSPIDEILRSSAVVSGYETKVLHNKIIVKGSILVSLLYLSGSVLNNASVEIPFTEVVDAEGISGSCNSEITVSVSESDITPETDLSGEYKMINAAVVLSVTVRASQDETVSVITDAYLPHGAMRSEKRKITLRGSGSQICEEEFIKGALTLPPSFPPISKIFDLTCRLSEPKITDDGEVSASAEASILYISSDPSSPLVSFTGKIPFTHRMASSDIASLKISLNHCGYSISSANEAEIRLSVKFSASPSQTEEITVFTSAEEEQYTPPKRASIVISFVGEGDTLWSVAKKHNITRKDIVCANALTDDEVLKKGSKLIIPR